MVGGRRAPSAALRAAEIGEIVAIGVDGHGPTLVAVDRRGEATRPAITFLDSRAAAEADELAAATGVHGWALGGLPAALWVERHEPEVAAATCWYLDDLGVAGLPADRRGGGARSSRTSWCPDPATRRRRRGPGRPPAARIGRTGEVVGTLTETAADALGAPAGRPVVGGTVDAFASYLGAGLLEPGDAYDPGGSAGGFGVYWDRPVEVPGAFVTPGAAGRPVQRRRGDGRHGPGARLVSRPASWAARSRSTRSWPRPPRRRPAPTVSSSCRTSPASARRSGIRRRAACSPV